MAEKRYGMVINLHRCIGCQTCAIACKSENNVPMGMFWNRVLTVGGDTKDTPKGTYPYVTMNYMPFACQHCDNPPCVKVCPVQATYKRESDGVVLIDYDRCIGCRYCMAACPYGVRTFNWGHTKYYPQAADVENASTYSTGTQTNHSDPTDSSRGRVFTPKRPLGVVEKCSFCVQRIDEGVQPFCIEVCPTRARVFGDLNDPDSAISRIVRETGAERILEELGTEPKVYFVPAKTKARGVEPDTIEEHVYKGVDQ